MFYITLFVYQLIGKYDLIIEVGLGGDDRSMTIAITS